MVSLCLSVFIAPTASYAGHMAGSNGTVVVSSGRTKAAAADDCEAVAALSKKWEGCLFCRLYKPLFIAAQSVTRASSNTFGGPFANLLAIGIALFIAYETLKMVASFTQQDIRKYLNTVSVQFFKVMLVFFLLKNMASFYNLLVNPILLAGFDFGSAVAEMDEVKVDTSSISTNSNDPTFGYAIYDAVEKFSTGCQAKIAQVMAFGKFLMCFSREQGWKGIVPDFQFLFTGLITFLLGTVIMISFGFLLIDAMVQMGIFGALAPFCLASWPFKITRSYTQQGWKIFSGVFLTYAMAGVTLKIVFALVAASVTSSSTEGGASSMSELAMTADTGSADALKKMLGNSFSSVFISLACAVIAFRLTGKISELVGSFGGDAGSGIGSDMGKQAMTAAKRLGTSAAGAAAKGAKAVADASGLTEKVNNARQAVATKAKNTFNKIRPSNLVKKAAGSETAKALAGAAGNAVKKVNKNIAESKLGRKASEIGDNIANSKVGKGMQKVGKVLSNPKEALKEADTRIAHRINHREGYARLNRINKTLKNNGSGSKGNDTNGKA